MAKKSYASKEPLFRDILERQFEEWGRRARAQEHLAAAGVARAWRTSVTERSVRALGERLAAVGDPEVDWAFHAVVFTPAISEWYRTESSQQTVGDEEFLNFSDRLVDLLMARLRVHRQKSG